MAGNYRNYMKLLESWPLDKSKAGSDLGQHIRDQVKIAFSKGEGSNQIDPILCDQYYNSLKRIASNHYGKIYTRVFSNTASGLSREHCNVILSPEMQEYFAEEEKGFIHRVIRRFKRKNDASTKEFMP